MAFSSFKFWCIWSDGPSAEDGPITKVAVRFYEEDETTEDESDVFGQVRSVTRRRIVGKLKDASLAVFDGLARQGAEVGKNPHTKDDKEASKEDVVIYTDADFGPGATKADVEAFLADKLAKDGSRTPIPEQEKKAARG